ncbi:uncharacterized protein LY89DRAFT_721623 [Mollisia scopiformis]|uniref:Uncharacterized protein n=1 Tax=Mollisia scopiformis TaxID=149040 RepID=A0A194WYI3_MOLSC|nr:uncharacterized protein LY89DRAFT_721623 [Mollisia scopiformis]KUJ12744.1 hypothetical protein LY89DRAFT_721623 [Mollisia scopiformis]
MEPGRSAPMPPKDPESALPSIYDDFLRPLDKFGQSIDLKFSFEKNLMVLVDDISTGNTKENLPHYDRGQITKRFCIFGLVFAWLVIIACTALGILCAVQVPGFIYPTALSYPTTVALSFIANLLVALSTDALGYIHGVSLRWALFRDGRLHFNTNLRLFTSTPKHTPNRWPVNIVCIFSLVICYAAPSQLLLSLDTENVLDVTCLNGFALLALALGLLNMALLATWIMLSSSNEMITWSSNALNNALAILHHQLCVEPNRCMTAVNGPRIWPVGSKPLKRQPCAKVAHPAMRYVVILSWIWPFIVIVWFVVLALLSIYRFQESFTLATNLGSNNLDSNIDVVFQLDPDTPSMKDLWPVPLLVNFFIQCIVQGVQSLGFHSIELIIGMERDEMAWRAAGKSQTGARMNTNAFISILKNLPSIVLYISKPLMHWVLGLATRAVIADDNSIPRRYYYACGFRYPMVFVYLIFTIALAILTTFIAYRKPRGPQPAAYGHYQTLNNLIDDWTVDEKGSFWWGDKGVGPTGMRHAGTSSKKQSLGEIRMDALYL